MVRNNSSDRAQLKTFELVAVTGPAHHDFDALFASLGADPEGAMDAVKDMGNMLCKDEPPRVPDDLAAVREHSSSAGTGC